MDLLTVKETARILRVSQITVRRYIASGKLAAERVGRGIRVRREAIEAFVTPVVSPAASKGPTDWSRKPPGYAEEDLAETWSPSTPGGIAWVPIDRLDEYEAEKRGGDDYPQLNIIGIGRSGAPTNIAEHKDEYIADAILTSSHDDENDFDPDVLPGKPTTEDDPLWSIIGVATSDEPNDVASNQHTHLADVNRKSRSDDSDVDTVKDRPRTILDGLGISVGIGRSSDRTDIAEHKDEYLADAFDPKA